MHTNLYLVEKLDRQHRQHFVDQAARDYTAAQLSDLKQTSSRTMKRLKLIVAAVIVAATLVGAGPRAFTAHQASAPTVAKACVYFCYRPQS